MLTTDVEWLALRWCQVQAGVSEERIEQPGSVLVAVVKNRLKRVQYRPGLLNAFLAHTGLDLNPL